MLIRKSLWVLALFLDVCLALFGVFGLYIWFMTEILRYTDIRTGMLLPIHLCIMVVAGFVLRALLRNRPSK